jgi:hypothetical protein
MKALSRKRKGGLAGVVSGRVCTDLERQGLLQNSQSKISEAGAVSDLWNYGYGFEDLADAGRTDGPKNSVYFIRMGTTDAVKVGMARSLYRRLPVLQCGSPVKLNPVGYVNLVDDRWMALAERVAHHFAGLYGNQRFIGEWFSLKDAQIKSVAVSLFEDMGWAVRGVVLPDRMRIKADDLSKERRDIWAGNNKLLEKKRFNPLRRNVGVCVLDQYGEPNAIARAIGYDADQGGSA